MICQVPSCSLIDPMSWSTSYPLVKTNIRELTKHVQGYTASMWSPEWDSRPGGLLAGALALHLKEALSRCASVCVILKSQGRFVCSLVVINLLVNILLSMNRTNNQNGMWAGVSTPGPGKLGEHFLHSKMHGCLQTLVRTLGRHSREGIVSSYVKTTKNQVNNKQM